MQDEVRKILEQSSNEEISNVILNSYLEIEKGYTLSNWKTTGLDAGHFVEAVRRYLELKLFGKYTPIGKSLPAFSDKEMNRLLQATGEEALRIHIPRVLLAVYGMRNKRGIGHLSIVSANKQDSLFILHACKWVLSEIVRLGSNLDMSQTSAVVDRISSRQISAIWFDGESEIILADGLTLREQVILFLVHKTEAAIENLSDATGSQITYLRKIAKTLAKEKLIVFKDNNLLKITPKGHQFFEDTILPKLED